MVKMNIKKNPEELLKVSIRILDKSYKFAKKKEDLEAMLAIADRLMVLYGLLEDGSGSKKSILGFGLLGDDTDE